MPTETNDILKRWTEYYTELYSHTVVGDPEVLTVTPVTDTDNYPILQEEVEVAGKSLTKGEISRDRQYPGGAGAGRGRCRDKRLA